MSGSEFGKNVDVPSIHEGLCLITDFSKYKLTDGKNRYKLQYTKNPFTGEKIANLIVVNGRWSSDCAVDFIRSYTVSCLKRRPVTKPSLNIFRYNYDQQNAGCLDAFELSFGEGDNKLSVISIGLTNNSGAGGRANYQIRSIFDFLAKHYEISVETTLVTKSSIPKEYKDN